MIKYHSILIAILFGMTLFGGSLKAQDSVVVISEIHYNPSGSSDDLEFIELHNLFSVDVDLSLWAIDGAVEFDFPAGTTIPAGGYLVVARNPSALQAATGFSSALGPWSGALNNGGEKVELVMDAIGPRTMDVVNYGDRGQWPVHADGSGASLEKLKVNLPGNLATSWAWSQTVNGTPGAARASTVLPAVLINEIDSAASGSFFIELYNAGSTSVNLNNYVVVSSDSARTDHLLTNGTLASGAYTTVNAATLGYTPADGEKLFLYTPSKALVVDAVITGNFPKARFPDGDERFSRPQATTSGATNVVGIHSDIVINEILYRGYPSPGTPGTPAAYSASTVINYGDTWRYENTGTNQAAGWANAAHTGWPSGPALIGRETDTGNLPPQTIQTNLYTAGQITYYFEREFTFSGSTQGAKIRLTHKIDDGAVFYLNGVELAAARYRMPNGVINGNTQATTAGEANEVVITLDATGLVSGSNRLSVEVHQGSTSSSDMVFGLMAEVLEETTPAVPGTPFTESGEEWIELHNKGVSPIALDGWKLDDAVDFDFPANTTIPAGGYLVIAKDPVALASKYPSITILGPWSGSLANSSERVQLEDNHGNVVDEFRYQDSGRWSEFADGGGCSLELRDPRSDNSLPESWAASGTSGGWQTYTYRAVATNNGFGINNFHELIIGMLDSGEILLDDISVIEDPDGSAVQFISNGNFSSDTVGSAPSQWRLAGNHGLHGQTVVVSDAGNKVLKVVATGASREYHNHLQTTFANGEQVVVGRTYEISYRAKWLRGDNQVNTRLFFDFLSNTQRIVVPQQWGTPGAVNSASSSNKGPDFKSISHSPVVPAVSQAVQVEAFVTDPDGIGSVQLRYRMNNGSSFSTVNMVHQGSGRYTGTIPGQSGGTIGQFYITAMDNHPTQAAAENFPVEGAESRAMIQWQDNQANTTTLHNLRVLMRPSDRQLMYTDIHRMSNYRFPATLIVDEQEVYYNVGVRLKGSAFGRNNGSVDGLNIGFDPMQPFNGIHTSVSIERGGIQKQFLAKHIMTNAGGGMASMYDDPIRLVFPSDSLGNVSKTGLALVSASRYSSAWRRSQFSNGNEGTLYNLELLYNPTQLSGAWKRSFPYNHNNGRYEFADYPLGKETYRWGFQIRSNLREDNYTPLMAASRAIASGSVQDAMETMDINQWARTWAYMGLIGNDDTYTRLYEHNFRMFSRPSDDKLVALPWDLDRAFQLSTSSGLIGGKNLGSFLNQPTVRRLFMQHIQQLCNHTFNTSYASPWASHFASKTGGSYSSFINYINSRRSFALGQLPSNVGFAITTNSGANFSVNSSSTILEGDGWIDVASIQINGVESPVVWLDDDSWQIVVPLTVGANSITLTAHDLGGSQVGTDTITITNTSTTDLASSTNLVLTELMYHPADPSLAEQTAGYASDDDFEFIELLNIGVNEIDLSGCSFTNGITFTVPNGTLLASGARLVIARNPAAFALRYGSAGKQVIGGYPDKLSNGGETLTFAAANALVIFTVTYDDNGAWSEDADGAGYSLVNLAPITGTDLNTAGNWSPSRDLNGGSGVEDLYTYSSWLNTYPALAAANMAGEDDDFDKDGVPNVLEFALHSDPTDPASTPDMPVVVSEINPGSGTANYLTLSITRPIAIPGVSYTPESSSSLNNDWDGNEATVNAVLYNRVRSGNVETLVYRSRNAIDGSPIFLRFRVEKN